MLNEDGWPGRKKAIRQKEKDLLFIDALPSLLFIQVNDHLQ